MKDSIRSVKRSVRLYRQPERIGDVIEIAGVYWLVIGIQEVSIVLSKLEITYVCQNLETDFIAQPATGRGDEFQEFYITIRTGKEIALESIRLGRLFWCENKPFQSIEYTDVEIKFTDVVVSFLAKPIRPIARKEAKGKLLNERKKKINLSLA